MNVSFILIPVTVEGLYNAQGGEREKARASGGKAGSEGEDEDLTAR